MTVFMNNIKVFVNFGVPVAAMITAAIGDLHRLNVI